MVAAAAGTSAGAAKAGGGPSKAGGAASAPKAGTKLGGAARGDIAKAATGIGKEKVAGAATKVAGRDGGDAADLAKGATMGVRQYGNLDPTKGKGINGAQYTPKVEQQMRQSPVTGQAPDKHHGFPSLVDEAAKQAKSQPFVSGDGKVRSLVEVPGQVGTKPGNFEYITDKNGINHRHFAENGRPAVDPQSKIQGVGAMRALGRVAVPAGLAMDAADVLKSNTPVKTAVEKAAGWGGAAAAASSVGSLATPLLAGGIPGAIGYGAAVLGAGALGYFGGEAAMSKALGWLGY